MRLLRGLSFHWGWFLRYKLSAATASPPILGPPPPPLPSPSPSDTVAPTERSPAPPFASRTITQFACRPLRDIQHTHYHPQIVVVRVVSRCATGCREPHTYSADASPSTHVHPLPLPLCRILSCPRRPHARPPPEPHRSSIAPVSPRTHATLDADETFPGRSLNSNYGAVFETD